METTAPRLLPNQRKAIAIYLRRTIFSLKQWLLLLFQDVRFMGFSSSMEEYDQRKLSIFNQLNFFQLLTGFLIPILCLFSNKQLPPGAWMVACLPALVSILVLYLNKQHKLDTALFAYFFLYPFATCVVYLYGMNLGISLSFILYGILSVFFIKDIGYMIFSICFSMVSYFLLSVVLENYSYQLRDFNNGLYLFNQALSLAFIFYGLFLIKKENTGYQFRILAKHKALEEKNEQIQQQACKIEEDAAQLKEINALKNKLFTIISHDLKAPMYGLRNLFNNVQQGNMPAAELKKAVPDVLKDLNYTVSLMENLLQWAKAQMEIEAVYPQEINLSESITEVLQLLRLPAISKQISIKNNIKPNIYGYADRDMLSLVLRNLLSNAIKFTPQNGNISVGIHEHPSFIEIYIQDNGTGICPEALIKINKSEFYTTNGTASETGTGLGLMLCKEFLARNGGELHIESARETGSIFSFTIPKSA